MKITNLDTGEEYRLSRGVWADFMADIRADRVQAALTDEGILLRFRYDREIKFEMSISLDEPE